MKVYNTYTRGLEDFTPQEAGRVSLYVCGVTPYDALHVGHTRAFLVYDVIRRYLEWRGWRVFHVQNITDVDDKIIRRAREWGVAPYALSKQFTQESLWDCDALNIQRAHVYPRVTEHIVEIIALIRRLINEGYAYATPGGSVYFRVNKFERYGRLSGRSAANLAAAQARIETDPEKEFKGDFALWKAAKPEEPCWESPWGKGRPGWHIECSVLSTLYLGCPIDIHGGAAELVFPHHENELAQTEALFGTHPAVRFWMHCGVVKVNGRKMAKSLGNVLSVKQALTLAPSPVWRLFFLSSHYRSPLDISLRHEDNLPQAVTMRLSSARAAWQRIEAFLRRVPSLADLPDQGESASHPLSKLCEVTKQRFIAAMDNDFGTPAALTEIFSLINQAHAAWRRRERNGEHCVRAVIVRVAQTVQELLGVLGLTCS